MRVRRATREDDAVLLTLGLQALREVEAFRSELLPVTRDRINALLDASHALGGQVVVLVAEEDHGQVIGLLAARERYQQWTGEPYADGLVVYVDPPSRRLVSLQLIQALEVWANGRGLKLVKMCAPTPAVGNVFARADYSPVETVYAKRLP